MKGHGQEHPLDFSAILKVFKNSRSLACGLCFTYETCPIVFFAGLLFILENNVCKKRPCYDKPSRKFKMRWFLMPDEDNNFGGSLVLDLRIS